MKVNLNHEKTWIASGWIISICLLLPLLSFPVLDDIALFVQGGKSILNGGILYKDFIDLKSPLIYYLFSFIYFFSGSNDILIRLFDFVFQILTIYSLQKVINYHLQNKRIAALSGIIYALLYTTLNFSQTMHVESFMSLPLIWMLHYLQLSGNKTRHIIIAGFLGGLIIGAKYTFAFITLTLILFEIISTTLDWRKIIQRQIIFLFSIIIGFLVTHLSLLNQESYNGYLIVMDYLSDYASIPPLDLNFFKFAIKKVNYFLGDNISFPVLFALTVGAISILRLGSKTEADEKNHLYFKMIILTFLLVLSIFVERKFPNYHFLRLYPILSIFVAIGLIEIWKIYQDNKSKYRKASRTIIFILIVALISISPITKWFGLINPAILLISNPSKYESFYEVPDNPSLLKMQLNVVSGYLNSKIKPEDFVLISTTGNTVLNLMIKTEKESAFPQSCFYGGIYVPPAWEYQFQEEMKKADWLVVQKSDGHPAIRGVDSDSYQVLNNWPKYRTIFFEQFVRIKETRDFIVFKREPK